MFRPYCRAIFRLMFEQVECKALKDKPEFGPTIGLKHIAVIII